MIRKTNPYLPPVSDVQSTQRPSSTRCPVCGSALSRLRLVFPAARCSTCQRRIRLRNSPTASLLSTFTAVACFISLIHFEATPEENGLLFGVHALVFVALGTLWFHLFGRPTLAEWFGSASPAQLARERDAFRAEKIKAGEMNP